jgi:hypothetical protein
MSQTIVLVGIESCTLRQRWIVMSNNIWLHDSFHQ